MWQKILLSIILIIYASPLLAGAPPTYPPPSDEAYNATTWNGITGIAPSKNAVRDKIETLAPSTGSTSIVSYGPTALQSVSCTANALTLTPTAGLGIVNISVTQTGDANCAVTMAETGAVEGTVAIIKNISDGAAETLTFTTSSNVLRLIQGSPFVMGINETLILQYKGGEWLEIGRASGTIGISTLNLPSSDAAPSGTAGQIRHDTAVTSYPASGGAVSWYDGFVVRNLCDSGGCISPKLNEDVAVTTTATKLNYLTSATGTTGTASTNIVFSTSPALTTPTVATSIAPASADGATLGTAALEFSDLYLAAGGVIYGENDQANTITSSATGWTFAKPITVSDVTNDNYIKITNNAGGRAPTASVYELYPDAGIWKFNVNGTEYIPLLSNLATNAYDAANSVWAESNNIVMEGATANDYETRITPTDPTADRTITIPDATGTVQVNCTATHDYGGAAVDWTLSAAEMQCGFITATNANGAVNAILSSAIPGKTYTVNNGTGQVLTFKVTGQTGGTVANGKWAFYTTLAADVAEIYELP